MTGKIISVMNRKGGVGKTTTAVALADTFVSEHQASVVVVDLDPQASASIALAGKDEFIRRSQSDLNICGLLKARMIDARADRSPFIIGQTNRIRGRDHVALALIPNSEALWTYEFEMAQANRSQALQAALAAELRALREQFSYVIIDSPPGQSRTAETALVESDVILCPTVPDRVSEWGLDSFATYIKGVVDLSKRSAFFIVTRYRGNLTEHKSVLARLRMREPHEIALLASSIAEEAQQPIIISENAELVKRLGVQEPTTHMRLYRSRGTKELILVAKAIRRELGEDAE